MLSLEMLATADSLRHVREQIRFLVDQDDPRAAGYPDSWIVLAHALEVSEALESLAERLADGA